MVQRKRERDVSNLAEVEPIITDEMIAAGVATYVEWETNHIFEGAGGAASYAIKELIRSVYQAMKDNSPGRA
jgi:hypothetical protein